MLLYFNPGHEAAVINASPYYMPPANVLRMQRELAFLPAWYGNPEDYVLLNCVDDQCYVFFLKNHFSHLPQCILQETLAAVSDMEVSLWGISPQAIHFFSEINRKYGIQLNTPIWSNEYKYLNSRMAAKDCLVEIKNKMPEISDNIVPVFCRNIDEIEQVTRMAEQPMLAKAPYSSSGRGLLWLSDLSVKEKEFLHGVLKKQKYVSLEPVLNKDTDFAMQFMCKENGDVEFEGYSLFETNEKGVYVGNYLYPQEKIINLLAGKISLTLLETAKYTVLLALKEKYAPLYKGCVGVDMMIYKENGVYKLHPCLEINMRYNMGYLSMKIQQNYLAGSSNGKFQIEYKAKEGAIYEKHIEMTKQYPLEIVDGRIEKGYLSLCSVSVQHKYMAYVLVE